jgi:hypothetical protein
MKQYTDKELLDWLENEARLSLDQGVSLGQEEFSEKFVVWAEDEDPVILGKGMTLREALTAAIRNQEPAN